MPNKYAAHKNMLMGNYARSPLAFERGEGSWLISTDGTRYLDFASGIAVNNLGHGHPALVAALTKQAQKLWHVSNLYTIPEQEKVAEMLCARAQLTKAFFCNSGAEATEAAVKMARRTQHHQGQTSRRTILCSTGAFHGRTIAMLAATDREAFREGFGPMPQGFDHFPFGNMNVLRDRLIADSHSPKPEIAAIMVESVQGEGGAKPLPHGFLKELRALTLEAGCLLIADEVQIGVGRSGHFFSYEKSGMTPDIVAMAKGLGGGFPVGAVLASDAVGAAMSAGSHGSTFGGNPLAMAAVAAVLDVLDEAFLADLRARAERFLEMLVALVARHDALMEVRGQGFLIGLVLKDGITPPVLTEALRAQHLLVVPAAAQTIRLLPPLTASMQEIEHAVSIIDAVLTRGEFSQ